ncbi:MAG TPA: NAD(P)-dependent oxidoreductase [Steroidobacteraceae bacterium]|nr:NAD(P)-dependent oxidoreductase [Steroidobacteraceae bacterium]
MGEKIAFIGVGRMGSGMVARLMAAGHELTLFDPNAQATATLRERGARIAASIAEAAASTNVVMASVPGPADARAAAVAVAQARGARVFVDLSTSGPAAAQAIAATLQPAGIAAIDAPVSGGVKGAAAGKLAIMASGPRAALEQVQPLLSELGKVFLVGDKPGLGQTVKLANNLMSAASLAIAAEAMAMGVKAGVDPAVMLEILNASSGRNSATQDKIPKHVLNRKFDFGFANALSFKDVRLCLDEAEGLGVPMVVGAAVRQMLSITQQTFGKDADCTDLVKVVEQWADCEIRGTTGEK